MATPCTDLGLTAAAPAVASSLAALQNAVMIAKIAGPILGGVLVIALIGGIYALVKALRKIKAKVDPSLPEEYRGFIGTIRFLKDIPKLQFSLGAISHPGAVDVNIESGRNRVDYNETAEQRRQREEKDKKYAQEQEQKEGEENRKRRVQRENEDKVHKVAVEYQNRGLQTVRYSDLQNTILQEKKLLHSTVRARYQNQDVCFKKYPYPTTSDRSEQQQREDIKEYLEEDQRRRRVKNNNVVEYVGFIYDTPNFGFVERYYNRGNLRDALYKDHEDRENGAQSQNEKTNEQTKQSKQQGNQSNANQNSANNQDNGSYGKAGNFTDKQIAQFAHEVAKAVKAYHDDRQVVRYVCTRNVLLEGNDDQHLTAKLDPTFEPSNATDAKSGAQRTHVGPVSWLAPEAMESKNFTAQSDIFSYGVFLWELFARQDPYHERTAIEVACPVLHKGLRLQPTDNMPDSIRSLMQKCFAEPNQRPNIADVERTIAAYYQSL